MDRKATDSGITLTLERVTDSPGQPEAVVCLRPTDGVRGWFPSGGNLSLEGSKPIDGQGKCLEVMLNDPLVGPSSLTVAQVELNPASDGDVIRSPWTFEFEVPETSGS